MSAALGYPSGNRRSDETEVDFADDIMSAFPHDVRRAIVARVAAAIRDAAATWPTVRFPPAAMMFRRLAERIANDTDPLGVIDRLHLRDLCLASACATGEPRAMEDFERQLMSRVGEFVRKIDRSPQFADEVRQELREKLFFGRDGLHPRIAEYGGAGPLEGWFRVVAVRAAHNLVRARKVDHEPADDDLALKAAGPDPELAFARMSDYATFRAVFEEAMATLSPEQRTLLRLHYLDGLSSGSIGDIERVSGATIRRWIDAARQTLLKTTRRLLAERFAFSPTGLDSVWADLESGLDLSLSRLLRSQLGTP